MRDGQRFSHGDSVPLLEKHDCRFAAIDVEHYREYLGFANWLNRGAGYPALQLIWPDSADRFPDHAEFDPTLADRQPTLRKTVR